jgi:hypothetical protein
MAVVRGGTLTSLAPRCGPRQGGGAVRGKAGGASSGSGTGGAAPKAEARSAGEGAGGARGRPSSTPRERGPCISPPASRTRAAQVPSSTSARGRHGGGEGDEAELNLVPCLINGGTIREDGARFVKTTSSMTTWRCRGSAGRPGQRALASSTHPAPPQAPPRRAERRQSSP